MTTTETPNRCGCGYKSKRNFRAFRICCNLRYFEQNENVYQTGICTTTFYHQSDELLSRITRRSFMGAPFA